MVVCRCDSIARSSAKLRSSNFDRSVNLMPLGLSSVVQCRTQSMIILKRIAHMSHPYLIPDLISKPIPDTTGEIGIHTLDDRNNVLWYSIMPKMCQRLC